MSREEHQLAAILFTDIVGYTALMQTDEDKAMTLIRRYHEVLDICVGNHHGKVANNYGDGSLCIFPSALNGVNAAIAIQLGLRQDPVVPLRIGLHIGEVFFEEGRVFGDGVNVASRIQSMGQASTILFSREIFDKIKNHPEFNAMSLGKFAFKNVQDDMEVFALANPGLIVPEKHTLEGKLKDKRAPATKYLWPGIIILILLGASLFFYKEFFKKSGFSGKNKSIAVLPFTNMSGDLNNEYFSDGMTDQIITQLSKIGNLKVISRTSVMQYKATKKTIKQIAEELGVFAVLEGGVQKSGETVRINAQLINAATDEHIWAENYDRNIKDLFTIQSEVAQKVADQLNIKLNDDQKGKLNREPTKNKDAYEDYLRARDFQNKDILSQGGFGKEAEKHFWQAIHKDSTFALAWLGLAELYNSNSNGSRSKLLLNNKCLEAIHKALKYDPENSDAHALLGEILKKYTLDPTLSFDEFSEAIQLNPSNEKAYAYYSCALDESMRFKEAKENLEKASELDPVGNPITIFAWVYYAQCARDTATLKNLIYKYRAIPFWSSFSRKYYYLYSGKYDSLLHFSASTQDTLFMVKAYMGLKKYDLAKSLAMTRINQLEQLPGELYAIDIASFYSLINEKGKSIEWLNKAYSYRAYGLISIRTDDEYDNTREEPGYKILLEKLGQSD